MSHGFLHDLAAVFSNPYVAIIFVAALVFDFINGFHDAANSIATIVGTRVMRPGPAVLWAAWWNFAAAWFFGLAVANTVAKWVHDILKARQDADFEIVDLEDYKLPLLDEPAPPRMHQYSKPHTRAWSERIASLDAYIFVTPNTIMRPRQH